MAMGLSATDYEVVDLRPQGFGAWIDSDDDTDALILDLESPHLAAAAVANLRAHSKLAPVLLVSSDRPGWDASEMRALAAAQVLPLPVTRPVLLAALEDLLQSTWAVTHQASSAFLPDEEDRTHADEQFHTAEALDSLQDEAFDVLLDADDALDSLIPVAAETAEPSTTEVLPIAEVPGILAGSSSDSAGDMSESGEDQPAPLSAIPRTRRSTLLPTKAASSQVLDDLDRLRLTAPEPTRAVTTTSPRERASARRQRRSETAIDPVGKHVSDPAVAPPPASEPTTTADPIDVVRALTLVADQLYGVPETAEVVIADAVERTRADAGALLVPDDRDWRVAGGVGLRPLEHRYELHGESWLVTEIAQGHKGAIIEESDIARERLQGAPLASWRHLLAAPVPDVEALLILARRDAPPFDENDLAVLAALGAEAGPLLAAAVDTRALARRLWEFRDEADLPR